MQKKFINGLIFGSEIVIALFLLAAFSVYSQENGHSGIRHNFEQSESGVLYKYLWKNIPVYIVKRTPVQLEKLKLSKYTYDENERFKSVQHFAKSHGNILASELEASTKSVSNSPTRSLLETHSIFVAISLKTGCLIIFYNEQFQDPCTNTLFDLTGKSKSKNDEYDWSLFIPPYYIDGSEIVLDEGQSNIEITDYSPDILAQEIPNSRKIIDAVFWDKFEVVKTLLTQDASLINSTTETDSTLAHAATKNPVILKYLLEHGLTPNHINDHGDTPLMYAWLSDNFESAKLLIKHGAITESYSEHGKDVKSLFDFLVDDQGVHKGEALRLLEELSGQSEFDND